MTSARFFSVCRLDVATEMLETGVLLVADGTHWHGVALLMTASEAATHATHERWKQRLETLKLMAQGAAEKECHCVVNGGGRKV